MLGPLGRWNRRRAAPVSALVTLGVLSVLIIALVGTETGHVAFGRLIGVLGVDPPEWDATRGGFETLVTAMAPTFWVFFLLTGAAVIVLRLRDPHRARPFRIPLYPLPPLVFCLTSAYMLYSSVTYAGALSWFGFGPLAIGLVLYALSSRRSPNV
jgi:amino acid transporter